MKAELLFRDRIDFEENLRAELVLWQLPFPVRGCTHLYKYRMALIDNDICVMRYDNEAGKGDHKHIGLEESPYAFTSIRQLRRDFFADAAIYRHGR
jgi:hypothetical protein